MSAYVIRRIATMIPTLFFLSIVVFGLIGLAPGDPAALILGEDAPPEAIAQLREELGFNDPVHVRYIRWIVGVLRGDLGESIYFRQPVTEVVASRLEPTLLISLGAGLLAVMLGVPLGVLAAVRHNTALDQIVMTVSLLGVSMPNFWLGLNLILLFSLTLEWLPAVGYTPLSGGVINTGRSLILPIVTLGLSHMGLIARMTRSNMLEVVRQDYVRTARAKGLGEAVVHLRHALRNALIPTLTVIGLTFAVLIGGATVTEQIFIVPGIGRLVVESVARRDFPVIQGVVLLTAAAYALLNLIVDLLYAVIDPRIRYG